jgi:hypothetical protein
MTILERKDVANEFVDTDEVEDPACMNLEDGDPHDVFRNYVLPRIETSSRDEASAEVLASMRAGRNFSNAVLDTIESLPESKTRKLRAWVDEARGTHIYPYVRFSYDDHVTYGLMLTTGGPMDKAIARESVGEHYLPNDFAEFWKYLDAIEEIINKFPKHTNMFEENPFVEIKKKQDYDEAISEMGLETDRGTWVKPGLYDFRDEPPSYFMTVEGYIREAVRTEAEDVLSNMDIDDIKDVCGLLLERS